jgi:hypothetical protein
MTGLSSAEAADRLTQWGANALPEPQPDAWWHRLARQIASALEHGERQDASLAAIIGPHYDCDVFQGIFNDTTNNSA